MPYATPEEAIRARLVSSPELDTIVGGRFNPQVNTQEIEIPAVVYKRLGGAATSNLDGPGKLARYVFQIDIYAETESESSIIAALIEAQLYPDGGWRDVTSGVHGVFPDDTAADITDDPWRVWTRVFGIWHQGT